MSIWLGRPAVAINSLLASALTLTLINPLILRDVGFQLSFMATFGLIVLLPPLERGIFNLLKRRLGTEQVGLTMALLVWLAVATAPDGRLHLAFQNVGQNSNHQDKTQIALTDESLACRQYTHAVLGRS